MLASKHHATNSTRRNEPSADQASHSVKPAPRGVLLTIVGVFPHFVAILQITLSVRS